jgi:hypothetical protein
LKIEREYSSDESLTVQIPHVPGFGMYLDARNQLNEIVHHLSEAWVEASDFDSI